MTGHMTDYEWLDLDETMRLAGVKAKVSDVEASGWNERMYGAFPPCDRRRLSQNPQYKALQWPRGFVCLMIVVTKHMIWRREAPTDLGSILRPTIGSAGRQMYLELRSQDSDESEPKFIQRARHIVEAGIHVGLLIRDDSAARANHKPLAPTPKLYRILSDFIDLQCSLLEPLVEAHRSYVEARGRRPALQGPKCQGDDH